jgi:predicted nucleic acid-binding protein
VIGVDATVLAYAVNRGAPGHARAAAALEALAGGDRPFGLPLGCAHQFVRFVSHPHAVARTLTPALAWAFVERLLESPAAGLLLPTRHHRRTFEEVLEAVGAQPGIAAGLETATVLREHGIRELLSADPAMRRFAFLSVRDPLHGPPWSPDQGTARRYRVLSGRTSPTTRTSTG